jgi:Bacterial SH3 domain
MTLLLNIVLALLGLTGTLAAFGGETWRKGDQPLLERVTKRGWLALTCLILAFSTGVVKEVRAYRAANDAQAAKEAAEARSAEQQKKLDAQLAQIQDLQRRLGEASDAQRQMTERLAEQQLGSIEAAFKLAIKAPRETDDAVVNLNGQLVFAIPSRVNPQMQLYWGDQFEYSYAPGPSTDEALDSLELQVGERRYRMDKRSETIRIWGSSPRPMAARILNPRGLNGVGIKIFVRTTDSSQGQQEFRRLILSSPFAEFAKKQYKTVNGDIVRVRATPDTNGMVRSQLTRGSFVRVLQTNDPWAEVLTPEGRQGWMMAETLGEIE